MKTAANYHNKHY